MRRLLLTGMQPELFYLHELRAITLEEYINHAILFSVYLRAGIGVLLTLEGVSLLDEPVPQIVTNPPAFHSKLPNPEPTMPPFAPSCSWLESD